MSSPSPPIDPLRVLQVSADNETKRFALFPDTPQHEFINLAKAAFPHIRHLNITAIAQHNQLISVSQALQDPQFPITIITETPDNESNAIKRINQINQLELYIKQEPVVFLQIKQRGNDDSERLAQYYDVFANKYSQNGTFLSADANQSRVSPLYHTSIIPTKIIPI
jgi:hypothetical protein